MSLPEPPEAAPLREDAGVRAQQSARHLLQAVLNRLWIVALAVVVCSMAAAIYVRRAPRLYRATATVQVEAEPQRIIRIQEVMAEELRSEVSVNTMVQKLRSRPLLARVIDLNQLAEHPAFAPVEGQPPLGPDALVARLEGMVQTTLRRLTRLVDITVSTPDPELSARIANSIATGFAREDYQLQTAITRGASNFLQQEADRLKAKLQQSEEALQKCREEAGSIGIQRSQDYLLPKLQEANVRLGQARAAVTHLQARYEQICAETNHLDDLLRLPQIATEPALVEPRARLAQANADFSAAQLRYKPKHPKYQQASQRLDEARDYLSREARQLPESYRLAYESAVATATNIAAEVKQTEADAVRLSAEAIRYNMLSREVESDRALLASVLNRLSETSFSEEMHVEKLRFVQAAVVPRQPASPRVALILLGGVLVGLVSGLAIALTLHSLDGSILSADQAEAALGLPVLNVVPRLKGIPEGGPRLVGDSPAHAAGAEAFRSLRTALSLLGRAENRRTFLFTSTVPQEGKTFTSINCAAAFAQQGLKTLLVDADLRRPSVENYLTGQMDERPGLAEYLTGQQPLPDLVQTLPGHPNLFWLAAGQPVPNPAELLAQDALKGLLAEALQRFDRVVVDSAPVTAVSDTLHLVANCQSTVLVVRSHFTPQRPVQRTVQLLRQAGARLCGVVLNLEPRQWGPGYYGDHRYYQSGYGSYARPRKARPGS